MKSLALAILEIFYGAYKFKVSHVTWPCPLQGQLVVRRLGLAIINLHTKFEVSTSTHKEETKGNAKFAIEIGVVCSG